MVIFAIWVIMVIFCDFGGSVLGIATKARGKTHDLKTEGVITNWLRKYFEVPCNCRPLTGRSTIAATGLIFYFFVLCSRWACTKN